MTGSQLKQVAAPLREAVLSQAPGTAKVVSGNGAHTIVLVVAKEQAGQRDLSMPRVRESITQTLKGQKEQLLRTVYLSAARGDAQVDELHRPTSRRGEGQDVGGLRAQGSRR